MPSYEYECAKCDKEYEVQVPLARCDEAVKCPHCKKPLNKKLSPVLFRIH